MKGLAPFAVLLVALLLGPILLHRHAGKSGETVDETLVIITPHNEATRYEFARAFRESHFARTGRRVFVDWRTTGGTSEIARYVAAQYLGSFKNYWTQSLQREWTPECAAFDDPRVTGSTALAARKAFLVSDAGCGIDLFFGGGSFDYMQMAAAGRLVNSGVVESHPELFGPKGSIPNMLGGEVLWDPKGCWMGDCLGAFGICYNVDSLARLGIAAAPVEWSDLASPRYNNELALADPTQSGSVAKAFEMILQQQMGEGTSKAGAKDPKSEAVAVANGWMAGMQLIQRMAANARYFTDGSTDIPYSVQSGDAAAGMCIDFYGRFESEAVMKDGTSRLVYITPQGGSSNGADSIGLFRGAPHAALAREFMDFVISPEGQKLWCFRAGTPGGPEKYTLRRLPIRPDLYEAEWKPCEADPGVNPFAPSASALIYQPRWTGSLFAVISFAIKSAFIDPHDELKQAWQALIAANFPPQATSAFSDLTAIDYTQASGPIRDALRSPDKLVQVRLARELDERFRDQYKRAAELARQGL
jgi:iron(III) transport system substrate-binding protein